MPKVNALGNFLTGYVHTDQGVQDCVGVYPADDRCRIQGGADGSHAKWHEQNGNGLLDLMFVCDDVLRVTSAAAVRASPSAGRRKAAANGNGNGYGGSLRGSGSSSSSSGGGFGGFGGAAALSSSPSSSSGGPLRNFAAAMVPGYRAYVAAIFGGGGHGSSHARLHAGNLGCATATGRRASGCEC